jgi:hypothetical protein
MKTFMEDIVVDPDWVGQGPRFEVNNFGSKILHVTLTLYLLKCYKGQ